MSFLLSVANATKSFFSVSTITNNINPSVSTKLIDGCLYFVIELPQTTSIELLFKDLVEELKPSDEIKYYSYLSCVPVGKKRGYKVTIASHSEADRESSSTKIFGVLLNVMNTFTKYTIEE